MDWKGERRSNNIDDQRSAPLAAGVGGAAILFRFLPYLIGTKIGRTILVIGGVIYFGARLLGVDILQVMGGAPTSNQTQHLSAQDQEMADFVSAILGSTEDAWKTEFQKMGRTYQEPILTLFRSRVNSACGLASSATGPFYCPGDNKLYIDLSFYEDMKTKLGAPGDFAQAYVIAHEVGHHVQNLLGISTKVSNAQRTSSSANANALSVRLELQADCFAGIWGHYANTQRKILDAGDINEALNAAAAIGDDRLQEQATGTVRPEKFTHGTSKQRAEWFNRGFQTGSIESCNTFKK
jgi:predicted metalloprotease